MRMPPSILFLLICYSVGVTLSYVLEHPHDVTVVMGDPATLVCRVDTGDVRWFKDGVEMEIEDDEQIFLLPDGSLFFLSSRIGDTALYNCGVVGIDGETVISDPAALIVTDESEITFFEDIDTSIMRDKDYEEDTTETKELNDIHIEDITESTEINTNIIEKVDNTIRSDKEYEKKVIETTKLNAIRVEVIKDEIPATVYIISMIIVGAMTVLIIAGAAIIFTKMKHMPSEHDPEAGDKEWQTPMMYSSTTLDCSDGGWRNVHKLPTFDLYSDSVHHYDKPVNFVSGHYASSTRSLTSSNGHYPSSNGHYASSKVMDSIQSQKRYQKLKPIYILPKDHNSQ